MRLWDGNGDQTLWRDGESHWDDRASNFRSSHTKVLSRYGQLHGQICRESRLP